MFCTVSLCYFGDKPRPCTNNFMFAPSTPLKPNHLAMNSSVSAEQTRSSHPPDSLYRTQHARIVELPTTGRLAAQRLMIMKIASWEPKSLRPLLQNGRERWQANRGPTIADPLVGFSNFWWPTCGTRGNYSTGHAGVRWIVLPHFLVTVILSEYAQD